MGDPLLEALTLPYHGLRRLKQYYHHLEEKALQERSGKIPMEGGT